MGTGSRTAYSNTETDSVTTEVVGQSFTAVQTGWLSRVLLRGVTGVTSMTGGTFSVHEGGLCGAPSDACNAALTTQAVTLSDGVVTITPDSPVWIEAGETYVLRVETEPGQPVGVGVDATDPYAAGQRLGGVASEDLSFAAYVWTCSGGECGADAHG